MAMFETGDSEFFTVESVFQEGLDLLESDHFEEALQAFEYVIDRQPFNADALFHHGLVLLNLKRLEEALDSYQKAILLAPTEAQFHSQCGYAMMIRGMHDDALARFDYALDLNPDLRQALLYKACLLAEKRRLGEARSLFEQLLDREPDDPEALLHLSGVLSALGENDNALDCLSRLLAKSPNHKQAIKQRGTIQHHMGRLDEAIRSYREWTALAPEDLAAWRSLLSVLLETRQWRPLAAFAAEAAEAGASDYAIHVYHGISMLEQHLPAQALPALRRARELNDRDAEVHYLLARAYADSGKFRQAAASASRALQMRPDDNRVVTLKACIHRRLGELETELYYLNLLLEKRPDDFDIVRLKVHNQLSRHQNVHACATLEHFLQRVPGHTAALLMCAEVAAQLARTDLALLCYRELLACTNAKLPAAVYRSYAEYLLKRANTHEASEILERGCRTHPDDATLLCYRTAALQNLGQHSLCIEELNAFTARHKPTPEIHWLMGRSLLALEQYEESLKCFQLARTQDTRCNGSSAPSFRWFLAEAGALRHLGRTAEAIRLLERNIVQFEKYKFEYTQALGELCEAMGAYAKAQVVYSQGLRQSPNSAVLHYRMARASFSGAKKTVGMLHLRRALDLDPQLATTVLADPVYGRLWHSIQINRIVGFRLLARRLVPPSLRSIVRQLTAPLRQQNQ